MKRIFIPFVVLLIFSVMPTRSTASQIEYLPQNGTRIDLQMNCRDITQGNTGYPKSRIKTPSIYQDDHILYLISGCEGTSIVVKNENGVEVFECYINDDSYITIPSTLSGEYELHIHRGNYCFYGLIEL